MDWLSDVWSGVKSFFGGGQSDEEKRRKQEEARQRAAQEAQRKQQEQRQQQATRPQAGGFTIPSLNQPQQNTPIFGNQQKNNQPFKSGADIFTLNRNQPTIQQTAEDRELIKGISGYYVMSPAAQQEALQKARILNKAKKSQSKSDELAKKIDENPYYLRSRKDEVEKRYSEDERKAASLKSRENRLRLIGDRNIWGNLDRDLAAQGLNDKQRFDFGNRLGNVLNKLKGNGKLGDMKFNEFIENYNALSGDEQADVREGLQLLALDFEMKDKNDTAAQYATMLATILDKDYGLVDQKDTSFWRNVGRDISQGGFVGSGAQGIVGAFGGGDSYETRRRNILRGNVGGVGMGSDLLGGIFAAPVDVTAGNIQRTFTADQEADVQRAQQFVDMYKKEQMSLDELNQAIGSLKSNDGLGTGFVYDEKTGKLRRRNVFEATSNFAGKTIEAGTTISPFASARAVTGAGMIDDVARTGSRLTNLNPAQAIAAADAVSATGQLGGVAMQGKEITPADVATAVVGTVLGNIGGLASKRKSGAQSIELDEPTFNTAREESLQMLRRENPDISESDAAKLVEEALESQGVKKQSSFAPLDETTASKARELEARSKETPQPEGTIRLYQMTENGVPSPNYFDNLEQLANYANGRSQNADLRFVDVPADRVQPVAGKKGEAGVFEIKPDEGSVEGVQRMLAQADDAQQVIPEVQERAAQQAEGGRRNRGISAEEVMERYRERNRIYNEADPKTRAEIEARASQTNPDDVTMDSPWGREAVWADLVNILGEQDARTLSNRYNMTAQEWRAVLNATGDLSKARNRAAVLDSQIRKVLNREPAAPRNFNAKELVDTPAGMTNPTTGEIVDAPQARTTSVYENDIQQVRDYMESLLRNAEDVLVESGSSWEVLSRKIQQADRTGQAPNLTDVEARTYGIVREELDKILEDAGELGRLDGDVGMREWYLPQARRDSVRIPETMEDIYDTGFGYQQARSNAIDLEDLDYGFNPVIDYAVRGRASEAMRKQTIFENYRAESPNTPIEQLEAATELRYANDKKINEQTTNPKADPEAIDTVGNQAKVAEALGIERVNYDARFVRDLNVIGSLNNAGLGNRGFNQYRRATALAQNFETPEQLFQAVRKPVAEGGLELPDITRERASRIIERLDNNLNRVQTPEEAQALMSNAIRALSKANIDEMLLRTNFTDAKLAKLVNSEYNRMAIGFNKATTMGNQIGANVRRVMNASMRGFNLNSALTELTDVVNAMHIYGRHAWRNLDPRGTQAVLDRWGQSGIVARMDNPDVAVEVFDALSRGDKTALKRISDAADSVEEKLALYRAAENYKAALFLKSAEDYWAAVDPNLQGTALTNRILDEFDKNMLPLDHFTRVFSSDNQMVKLLTQYLDWNILNTRQQARNLIGSNDSGIYRDMGRGGRIARNLALNLAPRVGVGMVRGVPIITTVGVLDPLGIASQDYSGVQDKNTLDEIMDIAGVSPLLSIITGAYFNYRQDEIANENYDGNPPEDKRGNWLERTGRDIQKMLTPYGGQIGSYDQLLRNFGIDVGAPANGRGSQAVEMMQDGYSENRAGRVQYLAPENPLDIARAWLMGKGQTQAGREYSGTPDIFSVMAGDATLADLWSSNPSVEAFTGAEGDYLRPISDNDFTVGKDEAGNAMTKNFNDMIKGTTDRKQQEKILEEARAYNAILDEFRRENPQAAEAYDQIMSNDDLVSPEYWREIIGTAADGSINLDIFKMIGDRKKHLAKTLGAPYDPMYDLPDDQARSLLQMKATATGDDIALRNILYKSDWYNKYVEDREAYYDQMPEASDVETRKQTERVKQWNEYDKQLNALSMLNTPELERQFPYNAAYKAAQREYEEKTGKDFYGSEEAKAWWSRYGAGKKAEDEALDAAKLEVINQMRVIEGHPPMSMEQYQQATEIADTSGGGSGRGGRGGGGARDFDFIPEFYNSFRSTQAPKVKRRQVAFKPNTSVGRRTNQKANLGAKSSGSDSGGYSL